ncbi:MAG: hypothetical protein IKF97_00620 [Clostridia bacterium]|nr:hypothetical protein [Clostridia bacterium]
MKKIMSINDNTKNISGITLIALIITIVVTLILASITIASITGNDASIEKTGQAKNEAETQAEIEELQKVVDNAGSKGFLNGNFSGSADVESIKTALSNYITDTSVITGNGPWQIESKTSGVKYLINQSREVTKMPENTGTRTEMNVQVGDFVNYDAGKWTQKDIDSLGNLYSGEDLPISGTSTRYTFGGFKVGQSRNDSITPSENEEYENVFSGGWRVLSVNNDNTINIVHAGTPESYRHYTSNSISLYVLKGEESEGVNTTTCSKRNWTMYENTKYAVSNSAHLMNKDEAYNITNSSSNTDNSLRTIGTYYWLADLGPTFLAFVMPGGRISHTQGNTMGIRPVVTLKAECLYQNVNSENVTTHNTPETAWNLVI